MTVDEPPPRVSPRAPPPRTLCRRTTRRRKDPPRRRSRASSLASLAPLAVAAFAAAVDAAAPLASRARRSAASRLTLRRLPRRSTTAPGDVRPVGFASRGRVGRRSAPCTTATSRRSAGLDHLAVVSAYWEVHDERWRPKTLEDGGVLHVAGCTTRARRGSFGEERRGVHRPRSNDCEGSRRRTGRGTNKRTRRIVRWKKNSVRGSSA